MITKPYTETPGRLDRQYYYGGTSGLLGNNTRLIEQVTHGPMVKGDKKHANAWSYYIYRKIPLNGEALARNGSYGGPLQPIQSRSYGFFPAGNGITSPDLAALNVPTTAYNKALDKLNERVRGGLDLSVAMAESSATLKMVKNLTKAKRYFSGIGSKRWANEFLEYKYGWLPLLSDIYNVAEEIQNVNLGLMRFKGRGSDSKTTSSVITTPGSCDITGLGPSTSYPVSCTNRVKLYNACEIEVWLKPPTSVQQLSRWTSLNPLSIAWELTPYSFVFDWFFDVGSYLRDVETAITYNSAFLSGYRSELYVGEYQSTVKYSSGENPYFQRMVQIGAKGEAKLTKFSRVLLSSYPLPRIPSVNTDLSSSRLLSAASLLRQFLR